MYFNVKLWDIPMLNYHDGDYITFCRVVGENKDLKLVDSPVSGGVKRASTGELTV